ncbi:type VII secretion integral membrane protein EccD [Streptomyces sp. JJ66]|uniref:type VII secretion integral membrane protein EccD n=1 Tax=Streptomyces sp. JJ66 TaxID=2803843 RepID=UPI001C58611A|nr:type VII secretion integral membrane protein EccD [Streptomyces sp. JJ66]MBW1601202.1 type VII secretion integral membrane protein EccD [Streptomyces sp. JJ66]
MSTSAGATALAPTATATGFCRVTIVAPDSRIDVALPEDIPVADLYPEILRLSAQTPGEGAPVGYHLVRRDGTVLDGGRSLLAQRVLDGEVLSLRPFADSLPPAVFDDVSDAVATAVARDRTLWTDRLMRGAGLTGGVVLLTLMAGVLWYSDPAGHDMHSLAGVIAGVTSVLLLALAAVRARVYDDRGTGTALGLAALPHAMIAGSGVLPLQEGHGVGRLQFLLGCVAVLLAAAVLIALLPGREAPFVAAAFAAAIGTLAVFGMILLDASALAGAAVCAPVAIGIVGFLPGLSARFARLPIGYAPPRPGQDVTGVAAEDPFAPADPGPVDPDRILGQVRRGHGMLLGLVGGCSVVVVGAAAVLGFAHNVWAQILALVTGLALLLRARLFRYTSQISCALAAGATAIALLLLALALHTPPSQDGGGLRTLWLAAALAAGAALLTAIGLIVPRAGLTPFWGRLLDLFDGLVLLSLTPLALAALDVYSAARSMTS